jgi:hypothetical protein
MCKRKETRKRENYTNCCETTSSTSPSYSHLREREARRAFCNGHAQHFDEVFVVIVPGKVQLCSEKKGTGQRRSWKKWKRGTNLVETGVGGGEGVGTTGLVNVEPRDTAVSRKGEKTSVSVNKERKEKEYRRTSSLAASRSPRGERERNR